MASTITCIACGKQFKVCLSCETKNSYRRDACCKEHSDIHKIVISYLQGNITKQEARKELSKYNVEEMKSWRKDFAVEVEKIFEEPVKKKPIPSAVIVNKK